MVPLATSVFYTHFPWWAPVWHRLFPSPPLPPFHLPFSSYSWVFLSVEGDTEAGAAAEGYIQPPPHLPLSLSPPNFVSLHTATSLQQPAQPSAGILLLQHLTHL